MADVPQNQALITVSGAKVSFGAVKALDDVTLSIQSGECVGLVGHNGAGKSTIVNVINGGIAPNSGQISFSGSQVAGNYGILQAREQGIRCVFQELSLCPNLSVIENTRIAHHGLSGWGWRGRGHDLISKSLDTVFPGHGISPYASVGSLSIAKRQMVEIAMAFSVFDKPVKLVILDEPTSSLDAHLAEQLLSHVRRFISEGGSVIFISHMMGEVLSVSDRIVVMKDGAIVAEQHTAQWSAKSLVEAMGSVVKEHAAARTSSAPHASAAPVVQVLPRRGKGLPFFAYPGEIVGLAGLGGHGQTRMLVDIYLSNSDSWINRKVPAVSFVAGDRMLNGVFPLWSILRNLTITTLGDLSPRGILAAMKETDLGAVWKDRIKIKTENMDNPILSLSGGNQQKVLFSRALSSRAKTVLMDDPMRGVDVGTKQEVYGILRQEAEQGRTFIWYSTEMEEATLCDRVYVFNNGNIVAELTGAEISEKNILAASFTGVAA